MQNFDRGGFIFLLEVKEALEAPTSSWRPLGPIDFTLCELHTSRSLSAEGFSTQATRPTHVTTMVSEMLPHLGNKGGGQAFVKYIYTGKVGAACCNSL